jgi:hypothetical protein
MGGDTMLDVGDSKLQWIMCVQQVPRKCESLRGKDVVWNTTERNLFIVNHPKHKTESWWSPYGEGHLLAPM